MLLSSCKKILFCFAYESLHNCSQSLIQVSSADCVAGCMVFLVDFSVASQFTFQLVLEDLEQRRKKGIVALCSLHMPGSLVYCCLEYVSGYF